MNGKTYLYILVCAAVSFLIRELPLTLIRRPIKSRFLRSFLFYVPYVTLAVMTFPSIVNATSSPIAGLAALVLGIAAAWLGANRLQVAVGGWAGGGGAGTEKGAPPARGGGGRSVRFGQLQRSIPTRSTEILSFPPRCIASWYSAAAQAGAAV